jgi:uncharacterized SAM-binding protein YcdF (DUF218 family)
VRAALLVAGLVLVAGVFAFLNVGSFLAAEDPLEHADAIFVFAGTRAERPLEAFDLWKEGYAPRVVVTRAVAEQAMSIVERRGIRVESDIDLNRTVLLQLGMPRSALIIPDRIHDNTAEEAQTLRELVVRNGWHKVILVTSKYHLRRAWLASRRELRGLNVRLIRRGSRYDAATPSHWWQRRADIRFLLAEVPKLIAYEAGLRD